jgi:hypothetical protein
LRSLEDLSILKAHAVNFTLHLSTRIQDKRHELPLINYMTDLALEAEATGFGAISLTEHHLHQNQGYQNSLLLAVLGMVIVCNHRACPTRHRHDGDTWGRPH